MILSYSQGTYLFNHQDLVRIFAHFGEIWTLGVIEGGKRAVIMLSCFEELFKAHSLLHGKMITDLKNSDRLQLKLLKDNPEGRTILDEAKKAGLTSSTQSYCKEIDSQNTLEISFSNQKNPSQANQLPKLTCKYEIEPFDEEASKAFLLSKRIIGPKGSNMKKIIEECFGDRPFEADALKLRLRGKGSGFKEGPMNKGITRVTLECNEPLHLCISAKNQFFYDLSSRLIEQLLLDVCRSFDNFVAKNDFGNLLFDMYGQDASACTVLKKESLNGHRPVLMYPESKETVSLKCPAQKKSQKSKRPQGGQHRQPHSKPNDQRQQRTGTPHLY